MQPKSAWSITLAIVEQAPSTTFPLLPKKTTLTYAFNFSSMDGPTE